MADGRWLRLVTDGQSQQLRWRLESPDGTATTLSSVVARALLRSSAERQRPPIVISPEAARSPGWQDVLRATIGDQRDELNDAGIQLVYELPELPVPQPSSGILHVAAASPQVLEIMQGVLETGHDRALADIVHLTAAPGRQPPSGPHPDVLIAHADDLAMLRGRGEPAGRLGVVVGASAETPSWEIARTGQSIVDVPMGNAVERITRMLENIGGGATMADVVTGVPHLQMASAPGALVEPLLVSTKPTPVVRPRIEIDWGEFGEPVQYGAHPAVDHNSSGRAVDVVLRDPAGRLVEEAQTCALGLAYTMQIGVGTNPVGNLVRGPVDPLDDDLPPSPDGHLLQISVLSDTVDVITATQSMWLPVSGPAQPVSFGIGFRATGPASARILISYQENLVQTFLFSTSVETVSRPRPAATRVVQQHGQTRSLRVTELTPRVASIVLNSTGAGSHQLYLKARGQAGTTSVDPRKQTETTKVIRNILGDVEGVITRRVTADEIVAGLARAGRELFEGIFTNFRVEQGDDLLREVTRGADQIIQIVRIEPRHIIPWAMAYDWFIPDSVTPTVCFGWADPAQTEVCLHDLTCGRSGVICCRGFWGVRHQIEESLAALPSSDRLPTLERAADRPLLTLGLGESDLETLDVAAKLEATLPDQVYRVPSTESLLERVWAPATRPAMMAVIGHCQDDSTQDHKLEPRVMINTGTSEGTLTISRLIESAQLGAKLDGRPLALLLACESLQADAQALTSFATTLSAVGFAGVIGTEIRVGPAEVGAFLESFVEFFVGRGGAGSADATVSGAMLQTRRRMLLEQHSPYGFAFTALAPSGLSLAA